MRYRKLKLAACLFLAACSTTPENPDPHREFNEDMLDFNLTIDRNVVKPVATGYKAVSPNVVRGMVANFLDNWKEPFYLVNYTVSGEGEQMATAVFRFVINSTFGVLGLFDVASEAGLEKHSVGYRETLKKIEMPHGDYIVLPIFSFSSTRDAIAEPISWFADPVTYFIGWPYAIAKKVLGVISDRAKNGAAADALLDNSMNAYTTTRSIYLQKYGVGNGQKSTDDEEDDDAEDEGK